MTQPKPQPSSKHTTAAFGIGLLLLVAIVLLLIPDMYLLVNTFLPPNPTSTSTQGFYIWKHPDTHEICADAGYSMTSGLNGLVSGSQFKTRILLDGEPVNPIQIRFIVIEPWDSPTFPDQDGFCLTQALPAGKHVLQVIVTRNFSDFPMWVTNFTVLPDRTIKISR